MINMSDTNEIGVASELGAPGTLFTLALNIHERRLKLVNYKQPTGGSL